MKVYDCAWSEISKEDWPKAGEVFVCKALPVSMQSINQKHTMWAVSIMGDGTLENDNVTRGMFWNEEDADIFANAIACERRGTADEQPT